MIGYADDMTLLAPEAAALDAGTAQTYAEWFATLADPTRVRLLHAVATAPGGSLRIGDLATALGISQSTCSTTCAAWPTWGS